MSYEYSENILVQENAGKLLQDELGWEVKFAYDTEVLGEDGTFGRKSYREVLLTRYFRQSLRKLNPWLTDTQVLEAEKKLQDYLASSSLMQINEEKYKLLRDGIPVINRLPGGRIEQKTAQVFDFQNPENNHFLAIKELKIHSPLYRRRTDIVGFVNGVPLVFMEFKKTTVDVQDAYTKNYKDYLDTIPHLFHYNAFLILSNGPEAKVGTLGSDYEFFHEWKRLNEEENGNVELQTMLYGMCRKETLLDLFENFILFDHSEGKSIKIVAKNHQYLGVNNAFLSYTERVERKGKLGVYWHTQGAGKSYSMVFLAQKIHRKAPGSPTILVLTDRDELNTQISDTFANCGLLGSLKASCELGIDSPENTQNIINQMEAAKYTISQAAAVRKRLEEHLEILKFMPIKNIDYLRMVMSVPGKVITAVVLMVLGSVTTEVSGVGTFFAILYFAFLVSLFFTTKSSLLKRMNSFIQVKNYKMAALCYELTLPALETYLNIKKDL